MVAMNNLASHKRDRTRHLIKVAGAQVLFLPPYSPDLKPIEMIFAKAKHLLRSLTCRTTSSGCFVLNQDEGGIAVLQIHVGAVRPCVVTNDDGIGA